MPIVKGSADRLIIVITKSPFAWYDQVPWKKYNPTRIQPNWANRVDSLARMCHDNARETNPIAPIMGTIEAASMTNPIND